MAGAQSDDTGTSVDVHPSLAGAQSDDTGTSVDVHPSLAKWLHVRTACQRRLHGEQWWWVFFSLFFFFFCLSHSASVTTPRTGLVLRLRQVGASFSLPLLCIACFLSYTFFSLPVLLSMAWLHTYRFAELVVHTWSSGERRAWTCTASFEYTQSSNKQAREMDRCVWRVLAASGSPLFFPPALRDWCSKSCTLGLVCVFAPKAPPFLFDRFCFRRHVCSGRLPASRKLMLSVTTRMMRPLSISLSLYPPPPIPPNYCSSVRSCSWDASLCVVAGSLPCLCAA